MQNIDLTEKRGTILKACIKMEKSKKLKWKNTNFANIKDLIQ